MKQIEISLWLQAVAEKLAPHFPVEAEQKCKVCQLNWKQLLISPPSPPTKDEWLTLLDGTLCNDS